MGYPQSGNAGAKLLHQRLRLSMTGQDEGKFLAAKAGCDVKRTPRMER